ncbi:MAG: CHAT domain-containing tetratricopeptide repeat protein [Bacteroidota bacterium]
METLSLAVVKQLYFRILISAIFLIFSVNILAQPAMDARTIYEEADKLFRTSQVDAGIEKLESAVAVAVETKEYDVLVKAESFLIRIHVAFGRYDRVESIIERSSAYLDEEIDDATTSDYYHSLARYFLAKGNFIVALENIHYALDKISPEEHPEMYVLELLVKGNIEQGSGIIDKAGDTYQDALNYTLKLLGDDHSYLLYLYNNLGAVAADGNDHFKAERFYQKSLLINQVKKDSVGMILIYNNLGNVSKNKDNYEEAIAYFDSSRNISDAIYGNQSVASARAVYNQGEVNLLKGDTIEAQENFTEVVKALTGNEAVGAVTISAKAQFGKAGILMQRNLVNKSLSLANDAHREIIKAHGKSNRNYHNSLISLAEIYNQADSLSQSLLCIDQFFRNIDSDFAGDTVLSNPEFNNLVVDDIYVVLEALKTKSSVLKKLLNDAPDLKYRNALLQTSKLAITLIEKWKTYDISFRKKQSLIGQFDDFYDMAITEFYHAGDLESTFQISERYRLNTITERLMQSNGSRFRNIPDSIINKENELRLRINYYSSSSDRDSVDLELLTAQQEFDSIRAFYQKHFPEYYNLWFTGAPVTISQVQNQLLSDDDVLLSYFFAKSKVLIFAVTKDDFQVYESLINLSEVTAQIDDLIQFLSENPINVKKNEQQQFESYVKNAHNLYELLIAPVTSLTKGKRVLIIPDAQLASLPIEVLLKGDELMGYDYRALPYLIKENEIGYLISVNTALSMHSIPKTEGQNKVLAFAPFSGDEQLVIDGMSLASLKGSKDEVTGIANHFDQDVFLDKRATKNQFLKLMEDYDLLHIASHGIIDHAEPMNSRIIFSDSSNDSLAASALYAYEMYDHKLSAKLAVLSACDTGGGQVMKGEGLVGLAHGFIYAGCQSIVSSMWGTEDKTTQELMNSFYGELSDGKETGAALRSAKLSLLDRIETEKTHPYFWAGFTITGHSNLLIVSGTNEIILSVLFVSAFGLVLLYFRKKLVKKSR